MVRGKPSCAWKKIIFQILLDSVGIKVIVPFRRRLICNLQKFTSYYNISICFSYPEYRYIHRNAESLQVLRSYEINWIKFFLNYKLGFFAACRWLLSLNHWSIEQILKYNFFGRNRVGIQSLIVRKLIQGKSRQSKLIQGKLKIIPDLIFRMPGNWSGKILRIIPLHRRSP